MNTKEKIIYYNILEDSIYNEIIADEIRTLEEAKAILKEAKEDNPDDKFYIQKVKIKKEIIFVN